ncbi:MAG: metallophosphoesterase, partial [Bacteroidota bacterium]
LIGYVGAIIGVRAIRTSPLLRSGWTNFLINFALVMLITRLVLVGGFVVINGLWALYLWLVGFSQSTDSGQLIPIWISWLPVMFAGVPLIAMTYGILFGKYRHVIERVTISFDDLPAGLDGFRFVQISDIHSGSWDSISRVSAAVSKIQRLEPEMIVFTGDLVNSDKDEIDPFIDIFCDLYAPLGKYAILGNHDYYGQPRESELRPAYYLDFFKKYEQMGWDLLLDQSRTVQRNGDSLKLVGVENWGDGAYFPKRGDLDRALSDVDDREWCLLLSHDPTHWEQKVVSHPRHIPLTLSGHTHGMQFGINLPFLKWSPVQYRYKRWMGLYEEDEQYLYVNRGFGYLGFHGRVGMWPEITEITLRRKPLS